MNEEELIEAILKTVEELSRVTELIPKVLEGEVNAQDVGFLIGEKAGVLDSLAGQLRIQRLLNGK